MEILAIIPARGGSKGVPNKNLRKLCGLSLLARSIGNARKSKFISRLIVSTDSEAISKEALSHGAEVPFMRPEELSGDRAETIDAFFHALAALEKENYIPDAVVCLQCTSPLVGLNDIDGAIEYFINSGADAVFSVCETEHHPLKMGKMNPDGRWEQLLCEPGQTCRQKLDKVYRHNGAIYIIRTEILLQQRTWFPAHTLPYIMDPAGSLDIDTEEDLDYLNFLLKDESKRSTYLP